MKRKLLLSLMLFLSVATIAAAQDVGTIRGKVVTRAGRIPIESATVTLGTTPGTVSKTDAEGVFVFENVNYGTYNVSIEVADYLPADIVVRLDVPLRDVNFITMSPSVVIAVGEDDSMSDIDFEGSDSGQSMSGSLSASKDVFDNIAGYKFGQLRFRKRGYDPAFENVYFNGIYLNDALTGYTPWSLWSGLNDATRNQESTSALGISDYGVGGVIGTTNIDARASALRKGFRASVVNADAQYRLRVMLSYASGLRDDGWAYAFSVSTRQGDNRYVQGVYYDAWAFYGSVEKQFNPQHRLSLTFLGVPTKRGAQMASTQETYDLVGDNYYNSNVGYQNGKLRNARVRNYFEPLTVLNYEFKISDKTKLDLAASFRFGKNGYSALDWNKNNDPRPDYYRELPGYQVPFNAVEGSYVKEDWAEQGWRENITDTRYIRWDDFYYQNRANNKQPLDSNGDPIIAGLTGMNRALTILSERHTDQRDFNFKAQLGQILNNNSKLNVGLEGRFNRTEYYNKVKDLLGGDYWLNVDNFAERDFPGDFWITLNDQSGTNGDNLVLGVGDKYGYDYYAHVRNARLWGTYSYSSRLLDLSMGLNAGYSAMWRQGLYKKALFADDSYGDSDVADFYTYTAKVGATYKLSGAHQFTINGLAMAQAPYFQDAFISPRTRNELVPSLTTEKIYSADLTYSMRLPWGRLRVTGFYTEIQDQTKLISFYDDSQQTFTNFAMRGIDQRHYGVELGLQIPIYMGLTLSGAVSYGDYVYSSNPLFTQTRDNTAGTLMTDEVVYWNGYKVENTPHLAAEIAFNYRTGNNWFFGVDFNYFNNMYLSMNPLYRTDAAIYGRQSFEYEEMTHQEKFDPAFVVNANVGKLWYLKKGGQVGFSLELKNLLNNTDIKTGGYEQMRMRAERSSNTLVKYHRFDSKYYYLYGFNYYLNVYFRF